jgi:PKD repeat protein
MKNIKFIFGFVCLLALAISCTVDGIDDDTSFINSVGAPTNIVAFYIITQDNSGLVTITPNGEGAVSYDVYYGDSTTEPVVVVSGKSTSHIYSEGTYTVKIIATGINGLKTEVTQSLVVSLKAPENLVVTISNDLVVSKKVNVTATADFATMFDV